jgi:hypothetical protein
VSGFGLGLDLGELYPFTISTEIDSLGPHATAIHRILLIRALIFRQDYRINKIFLPFQEKGKKRPLLIPRPFFPLKRNCVFSALSGSTEKNQVNPVIPSENILALCLNNYELINKVGKSDWPRLIFICKEMRDYE